MIPHIVIFIFIVFRYWATENPIAQRKLHHLFSKLPCAANHASQACVAILWYGLLDLNKCIPCLVITRFSKFVGYIKWVYFCMGTHCMMLPYLCVPHRLQLRRLLFATSNTRLLHVSSLDAARANEKYERTC